MDRIVIDLTGDDEQVPAPPPAPPPPAPPVPPPPAPPRVVHPVEAFAHHEARDVALRVLAGGPGADAVADAVARAVVDRMIADRGMNDGNDDDDDDDEVEDEEGYEDLDVRLDRMEGELRTARAEIERLTDRDELHRHEVEVLRNHVRRANADRVNTRAAEISRRDAAFFDGVRRRFVESWREDLDLMMKMQPHQLLFFGHLLNLPVISSTDKLE